MTQSISIPPEILDLIFRRCIPPRFLLNVIQQSVHTGGPRSACAQDIKTRLALANVCRLWRTFAIPLLYEHITFHRYNQILAFSTTIDVLPERRELVKAISVQFFIPEESEFRSLASHYTEDILTKCQSVRDFSVHPEMPLSMGLSTNPTLWAPITHLSFGLLSTLDDPLYLVRLTQPTLLSLSLELFVEDVELRGCQPIHLPHLTELYIVLRKQSRRSEDQVQPLFEVLQVPSLRVFGCDAMLSDVESDYLDGVAKYMEIYGRTVHSLFLNGRFDTYNPRIILAECPALEHLALRCCQSGNVRSLEHISHPNVKWIDVVPSSSNLHGFLPVNVWIDPPRLIQKFPNLRATRAVDTPGALFLPIIRSLPPTMVSSDGGEFELAFPGVKLSHQSCDIHQSYDIRLEGFINTPFDADDDSDSDYEYDEADSSSESESEISVASDTMSVVGI